MQQGGITMDWKEGFIGGKIEHDGGDFIGGQIDVDIAKSDIRHKEEEWG